MRISIKATNIELTDSLREYVNARLESVKKLTTVADESLHAAVEIGKTTQHHKQGDVFRAEVNFHIAHQMIRAVAVKDDLYAAIDEMKDELARELATYKDKERTLFNRGAANLKDIIRGVSGVFKRN